MRERPILFSAPMVRAVLSSAKTQTRRPVKPQPDGRCTESFQGLDGVWRFSRPTARYPVSEACDDVRCPYGEPGDRLWGRENGWQRPERTPKMMREGADTWAPYYFDADGISDTEAADLKAWGFKRRPSIHMPRAHSRILLEVTGVRVERLHAISEADCIAEGVERTITGDGWRRYADVRSEIAGMHPCRTAVDSYRSLWEHLGGPGSWQVNPWVWVVEFRRAAA